MKNAKLSPGNRRGRDVFAELVKTVFLFIHEHYGGFNDVLSRYRVNYTQYAALLSIYMYGSLSEGDLARMLFINPSTVSRMVYSLEQRGWLESSRDPTDRRKVMVTLTPEGRRTVRGMMDQPAEVLARLADGLDGEKREYVYGVAEAINQALRYMIGGEKDGVG